MRTFGSPRVIAHASGASTSASAVPPPWPWLSSGHCRPNNGSSGTWRDGCCACPAHAATAIPASQVARSALRLEQNRVPTVTRLVLDTANQHHVGAERQVASWDGAAVHRDGLARKEVELHVR